MLEVGLYLLLGLAMACMCFVAVLFGLGLSLTLLDLLSKKKSPEDQPGCCFYCFDVSWLSESRDRCGGAQKRTDC